MSKVLIFMVIIIIVFLSVFCILKSTTSTNSSTEEIEKILSALTEKNKSKTSNLFSKKIQQLPNFDEKIDELHKYINGEILSYQKDLAELEEETSEIHMYEKKIASTYNIQTTDGIYRMAINVVVENTKSPKAIGVECIYITKLKEGDDLKYAYWGDGKFTPGIHIGVTAQ